MMMFIKDEPIRPVAALILEAMSSTLDTPWTRRGRRPALPVFVTCVIRTYMSRMYIASNGGDGEYAPFPLAAEREHWALCFPVWKLCVSPPHGFKFVAR